ncbi:unnamed protein product [Pleuronectes platessa]|uniref:Uncharacterized protein n=1 Tax=Pleuronectes platessa TaxID=8262 RepID=A0A9N7U183_PLEPL|nr:unnamed protein product [Pleuronectes platessa]
MTDYGAAKQRAVVRNDTHRGGVLEYAPSPGQVSVRQAVRTPSSSTQRSGSLGLRDPLKQPVGQTSGPARLQHALATACCASAPQRTWHDARLSFNALSPLPPSVPHFSSGLQPSGSMGTMQ